MRRIVDPKAAREQAAPPSDTLKLPTVEVDLKDLLDRTKQILYRQIKQLSDISNKEILSKQNSDALVNYIKILQQLVKEEKEYLEKLSDAELTKLLDERK